MDEDVVASFWRGIDEHDWELVGSTIADDFERYGMYGTEADSCRGKVNYLAFVSGVINRMDHHTLKARKIFWSEDRRQAIAECIETIWADGQDKLVMQFVNVMRINDGGLIDRLDIYWKTPPRLPPWWITPQAILEGSAAESAR